MIKRFTPEQPDGIKTIFDLPERYIFDTDITLFVNGQLLDVKEDTNHPYGYFLDSHNRIFTFYYPPSETDYLYVMYDEEDPIPLNFDNIDWTKKVKVIDFTSKKIKQDWKLNSKKIQWDKNPVKISWDMAATKIKWNILSKSITFRYKSCTV